MKNDLILRSARLEDLNDVRKMSMLFAPGSQELDSTEFVANYQRLLNDVTWFLGVAEEGGVLVGYVLVQDFGQGLRSPFTVGRIHDLFVDKSERRKGTGRALTEFAFDWARTRPVPMILDWQARSESISFYEALGFTADYVGDFPESPGFTLDLRHP